MTFTEKQLKILEFIERWREENGISPTLEEMADHFGVTKITIYEHLNQLERKGAIRREKFRARSIEILINLPRRRRLRSLPLHGTIPAGAPLESAHTVETFDLEQALLPDENLYALRVQGDSMIDDHIQEGDYVIVSERSTAQDGDTVVAVVEGSGDPTLKRFFREKGRIRLQPANSKMQPIYARKVDIRGVVVGLIRCYNNN